jgi:hypothetical protein
MWLVLISVISVALNVALSWFCYKQFKDLLFVSDEFAELRERLEEFEDHLDIVYGLETFYGDETLANLLRHAKALGRYISKFDDITDLTLPQADLEQEEEDDDEEEDYTSEEKTTRTGKTVFYGGPR